MATVVIMPRQGQSVESCIITAWNKKPGDKVAEGDVLFSYETDKSSFDELAAVSGTMLAVLAEEGDDVECLKPVCIIGEEGEDISGLVSDAGTQDAAAKAEAPAAQTESASEKSASAELKAEPTVSDAGFMKISPRARHLAERTDADLSQVVPTGPQGRVIERDVNKLLDEGKILSARKAETAPAPAAEVKAEAPKAEAPAAEYEDVRISNIRKVIAKSMHASLSNMAQLTLNTSFDATKLLAYRQSLKANAEKLGLCNITLNDMILFAVAKTILNHRELNAHYLEDAGVIRYFTGVNLGIACDTERGLLVPTVFGAEKLTLNALAEKSHAVTSAAKNGTISPDLLKGASFTVSNLGNMGIESFTPVVNPPQTGILGVCTVTRRIKTVDGKDVSYPAMGLSLTFDHRALDGSPAARFLKELCVNLENFDLLLSR